MTNKEIAMKAMQELFVKRNADALNQYWKDPYEQHNPNMVNGLEGIRSVLPYVPENFSYEPGIVIAEGDIVMAHSRVIGWGAVPQIIVDVFRLEDGKIIEHWDVIQDEVKASESKNGNAMTSFNIHKYNMNSLTLTGNRFYATIGKLEVELTFNKDNTVTFIVVNGAGLAPEGHTETLPVHPVEIRKNVFFLGWTEKSGATVTHLEDYNREVLISHITMPDGSFIILPGKVTPTNIPSVFVDGPAADATLNGKVIVQTLDHVSTQFAFNDGGVAISPFTGVSGKNNRSVSATVTPVTQECFLVSWQEEDKTSVVQIIDLKQKIFFSNITSLCEELIQNQGKLN
jgi:predicted SnoaL-like aldol condensation-catalyzing enzyme